MRKQVQEQKPSVLVPYKDAEGKPVRYRRIVNPSTGITPREELFSQYMAQGRGLSASARDAGFAPKGAKTAATRMLRRTPVQARIAALQRVQQVATTYTLVDALREAEEARQLALRLNHAGALSQATRLKADLAGLLVQKVQSEVVVKTEAQALIDLSQAIEGALADPTVSKLLEYKPETPS